jgi:tetratricopeptide (TPR) repeat protein
VFFQPSKFLLTVAITGVLGMAPQRTFAQAAAPASQEGQKNWKDQAEYDLYNAIAKDTTPKTRLEKLQQWEKQYPQTDYAKERRTLFLTTQFALGQAKEAVETAKQILAENPKDFSALYITTTFTQALAGQNPTPAVLDQGEKAASALLANIDSTPPNFTDEQWKSQRPGIETLAHTNLGWIALQKKNWPGAQAEFQKVLQLDPNNGTIDFQLATAIYSEKDPTKTPTALFYFARAATYEGQGALTPAGRQQVMTYVQRAYKSYHGSDQGFNDLVAAAKSQPAPPAGFAIKSALDIAKAEMANEEEWTKAHPQEATWKGIKETLTGAEGGNYFKSSMEGAQLPTLKGKVVKLEPAMKPKTILIAIEDGKSDGSTADATLKFEMPLPGNVEPGTELTFEGVPESYTASPLMVVFNVDADKLHGWTGKNPVPVRRPAAGATKKAPAKK